ncbi:hypothetical protein HCJ76_03335 [Streptomyces sp. MC1]|uniref:hypothetical protein n=1 Tax=unclassified Streptomyces TaxID=2593676 RepID=UPI0004CAE7B2|nr:MULTISPECIES: hypothetical protein [Streptomyces]KOG60478.1 hypothetical protein ADK77_35500 [Streptomyces antibioticus]MBG7697156.1 hypothetical protein [Streptomyces sp. MC1]
MPSRQACQHPVQVDRIAVSVPSGPAGTASGYDLVGRPPVVAVRDGLARLMVRRESLTDIRGRDVGL